MNDTSPESKVQTSQNFFSAPLEYHQHLTKSDLMTYYAIGDLGDRAHCAAYQDEIAARAGVSLRQCQRSIAKLDEIGLLTIDRTRRQHHVYTYAWPKPGPDCQPNTTHESCQGDNSDSILIHTNNIDYDRQQALIENGNLQNLGSLDIAPQEKANLDALEIKADFRQPFPTAPELIKRYTPAQILMFHDPSGEIAANLARWRQAHDAGETDLANLTPALIWCKIVEMQAPPPAAASDTYCPLKSEATEPPPYLAPETESKPLLTETGIDSPLAPLGETPLDAPETSPDSHRQSEPDPAAELWADTLARLRGNVTRPVYDRHLATTTLTISEAGYIISTPNELSRPWLNRQLKPVIARALAAALGEPVNIIIEASQ